MNKTLYTLTTIGICALMLGSAFIFLPADLGGAKRIGPAYLYPDPQKTPCTVATSDFKELTARYDGKTYSQANRKTTESMKRRVCELYPENCSAVFNVSNEKDHCVPIALGGEDSMDNLWAQPEVNKWNGKNYGFRQKDALEGLLWREMKAGKITPNVAQECLYADWVKCYNLWIGDNLGGENMIDPDDEEVNGVQIQTKVIVE